MIMSRGGFFFNDVVVVHLNVPHVPTCPWGNRAAKPNSAKADCWRRRMEEEEI